MLRLGYHRKVVLGRRQLERDYVPPLKLQKLDQNSRRSSSSCFQGVKKPLAGTATNVGPQPPTLLTATRLSSVQAPKSMAGTNIGPCSRSVLGTTQLPNVSPRHITATNIGPKPPTASGTTRPPSTQPPATPAAADVGPPSPTFTTVKGSTRLPNT
ncbi:unnamed protein product, partial [Ixodes pacificus]